jgi:hypothetical protein
VQLIGRSNNGQGFTGLIAGTTGTGKAGDLSITTQQLLISNGAEATASSRGKGEAGNLSITASSVRLDNGRITAQTRSGNGGNLKLDIADLLLMRYGSLISTTAGTALAGGNGGNINIDADFIVTVPQENSDITANAFSGNGGAVQSTLKVFLASNHGNNPPRKVILQHLQQAGELMGCRYKYT